MILFINLRYHLVGSYEPGTLRLSDHTNAEHFFWFCLQVFCQVGPPQRVDCLASMGNKRRVYFPRTSSVRRIFKRRGAENLRIMKTKLKDLPSDSASFSAQIPKGWAMTQFCALFLGIYALLAPKKRGSMAQCLPSKYAPTKGKTTHCQSSNCSLSRCAFWSNGWQPLDNWPDALPLIEQSLS